MRIKAAFIGTGRLSSRDPNRLFSLLFLFITLLYKSFKSDVVGAVYRLADKFNLYGQYSKAVDMVSSLPSISAGDVPASS